MPHLFAQDIAKVSSPDIVLQICFQALDGNFIRHLLIDFIAFALRYDPILLEHIGGRDR